MRGVCVHLCLQQRAPLADLTNIQPLDFGLAPRRSQSDPAPKPATASAAFLSPPRTRPLHAPLEKIERYAAVVLTADGQSPDAVAAKLQTTPKAVRKWAEAFEDDGEVEDAYRCGRPNVLDDEVRDAIIEAAVKRPKKSTPRQLKALLDLTCSKKTVRRALDDAGLFGRIARITPPLTDVHRRKRVSFAEGYSKMDWTTVLWSDEMSIHLGPQGQTWVQRPLGAEWDEPYVVTKQKHAPKVHVWGCFCSEGVGMVYVFTQNLDKVLMKKILSECLIASAKMFWAQRHGLKKWWFQQDNDPKHSSHMVRDWLHTAGVACLEWPPYSPDLNPIENLWANLKKRVENHNPTTVNELDEAVKTEWKATEQEYCAKLVKSVPTRLSVVIQSQGGPTGY